VRCLCPRTAREVLIAEIIEPANVLTSTVRRTKFKEGPVFDHLNKGRAREQCSVVKNCLNDLNFVSWEIKYDEEDI